MLNPKEKTVNSLAIPMTRRMETSIRSFWMLVLGLAFLIAQSATTFARGAPESFADLVEEVSPAVVNITTSTIISTRGGPIPQMPEGSPFEDFFEDFQDRNRRGPEQRGEALGSGFVISADGYIVTNNHVIEGADEILIEFFSGVELPAELVGTDPNTDIAVLKVDSDAPLAFVSFGDSEVMRVGDWVLAMGNPLGQGFSVSAGIISADGRTLSGAYDDYLQTDAAINRGNSGGPLFNMNGEVIGVNTAILSPTGGSIGIGFAMSSSVVTGVVDQLQTYGETRRGWLGVRVQDLNDELAEAMDLSSTLGALITDVPNGPAQDAGLLAGDVILTFDGEDIDDTRDLVRTVGEAPVGAEVPVVVNRDGVEETIMVTLGRRETAESMGQNAEPAPEPRIEQILGMSLQELTSDLRDNLNLPESVSGVVVTEVDPSSSAYAKGVRSGDIITEAGQQRIRNIADFEAQVDRAVDAGRTSILLLIRRDGDPRFVALSLN